MKKRLSIGIIIGIAVLVIIIVIGIKMFFSAQEAFDEMFVMENSMTNDFEDYNEVYVTGTGTITSFNMEILDTTLWTKTDKVLVNNEDMVTANQEILNVSNEEANGKIYSTIPGRIFIEDGLVGKTYTIYDLDNLGFELQVPEEYVKNLKIGQKVECNLKASNESIYGRVCYISYIPKDEQITVKVKLDNSEKIKIGYTVNAKILLDSDVDVNTPVYDIKNSIPKIGKTTITYKNTGEQFDFSSFEELSMNGEILEEYETALEEQSNMIDQLSTELEILQAALESNQENNNEQITEDLSDYYSGYWKEYWDEYYKSKIIELQNQITQLNFNQNNSDNNENTTQTNDNEENTDPSDNG